MEARPMRLVAVFAAIALAASASNAASFPVTGELSVQLGALGALDVSGSGTAVANGSGGGGPLNSLALPAGLFSANGQVLPFTDPAVPVMGLQLTVANAAGTLASGGGTLGLLGHAKVCLFGPCSAAVANINVPLGVVGVGGAALITGSVNLSVIGAPWTVGTASIGTITRMGFARGPGSNASSTAAASGELRLVTPIFVSTNIAPSAVIPAFAVMTLHFVPEPATLALLCGGLASLAAAGRARMRAH